MDTSPSQPKILMVDDDSFLISMYEKKGEEAAIELRAALSGQQALDILKEGFEPDVIALDMSMAGMTGIDVLKEMQEKRLAPSARVIFLSNTADDATVAEAKALGADRFIVKASLLPSQVIEELIKEAKA